MKIKLLRTDGRQAQLQQLYRAAEEGTPLLDADPELERAFAADRRLMRQLGRLAAASAPVNPAIGRATLLAAVARERDHLQDRERRPAIGRLLTGRALALVATAGIFAGGAAAVGASGGVQNAAGNAGDVLAALHVTERTPDQADTHLEDIQQPDGSGKPADVPPAGHGGGPSNAEQHATDNADHGLQNAADGGENAGQGIQNASPKALEHANSHAIDGPSVNDEASDAGEPALPPQANEHAQDGSGNGEAPPEHDSSAGSDDAPGR